MGAVEAMALKTAGFGRALRVVQGPLRRHVADLSGMPEVRKFRSAGVGFGPPGEIHDAIARNTEGRLTYAPGAHQIVAAVGPYDDLAVLRDVPDADISHMVARFPTSAHMLAHESAHAIQSQAIDRGIDPASLASRAVDWYAQQHPEAHEKSVQYGRSVDSMYPPEWRGREVEADAIARHFLAHNPDLAARVDRLATVALAAKTKEHPALLQVQARRMGLRTGPLSVEETSRRPPRNVP